MRAWLRNALFGFLRRALTADDGSDIVADVLHGQLTAPRLPNSQLLQGQPYSDVCRCASSNATQHSPIFITGRFRSGSTLLWNVFRHLPGCTAYYEPLNERRWFDPRTRGGHTDKTHKHVNDYWREYDGLTALSDCYEEDWIRRRLYMDERAWDPCLKRYIDILIDHAAGRAVLQFNRVDFRLPWLRAQFPSARIVHLYRHPRDQWISTLFSDEFPLNGRIADFHPFDRFYLLMWARDLRKRFPVLNIDDQEHPYQLFYLIWRLSYLFGRQYADWSLSFESLTQDPRHELTELFAGLSLDLPVTENLLELVERPPIGKWFQYADAEWFLRHEQRCERLLGEYFAALPNAEAAAPFSVCG
jgi:hypothetical protein